MSESLYRSRYAKYYRRGPGVLLFHSLRMNGLFGNTSLFDVYMSFPSAGEAALAPRLPPGSEAAVEALKAAHLLTADPGADGAELSRLRADCEVKHPQTLTQLCLLPSSNCNLECRYCYVPKPTSGQVTRMSEATAKKSVDYFYRHSKGTRFRDILFYGGEPLLNPRAVFAAADRALALAGDGNDSIPLSLRLVSNGMLLDDSLAEDLASRDFDVVLSIDGPQDVNDRERRTVREDGTFEQAVRAFELLRRHSIEATASVTVTPHSLESWDRVLHFLTEELRPAAVVFNPLLAAPGAHDGNEYLDPRAVTTKLISAFERLWSRGIPEGRIGRRAEAFQATRWRFKDCPATAGQVVVTPDGSLGPCQGVLGDSDYFPLHIESDFEKSPFEHELFDEWNRRFSLNFSECLDCPAISICGGGCAVSALRDRGSIWDVDRRVCDQVKPVHEWLSWLQLSPNAQAGPDSVDGDL